MKDQPLQASFPGLRSVSVVETVRELRMREDLLHPDGAVLTRHEAGFQLAVNPLHLTGLHPLSGQTPPQGLLRMRPTDPRNLGDDLLGTRIVDVLERRGEREIQCVPEVVETRGHQDSRSTKRRSIDTPQLSREPLEHGSSLR